MTVAISAARLQGQLIATQVLVEVLLRALPAQTLKEISANHQRLAEETGNTLLNTQAPDPTLEAYNSQAAQNTDLVRHIHQKAIVRDSAAGRL